MSKSFLLAALLVSTTCFAEDNEAKLKVIASIPDFADMAREIGGVHVEVESLAHGTEDSHGVPVRPSMAAKVAQADVVIEMGLNMEHAWLPPLIDTANNAKLRGGGLIKASEGETILEIPENLSRTEGEQHSEGNPHVNLDPGAGRILAKNICAGLSSNAPQFKKDFEENLAKYLQKLDAKEKEWKAAGAKLKGVKFVSFHNHWAYWARYFEMEYVGTLEPKPGIPPSGSHLAKLIQLMKAQGVKLVVREPQFSDKIPNEVAEKVGGKVVKLAIMVNGLPEAKTWIEMIDANLKAMLEAVDDGGK